MMTLVGTVQLRHGHYLEFRLQNADATAYTPYVLRHSAATTSFTAGTKTIAGTGFPGLRDWRQDRCEGLGLNDGLYTITGTPTATSIVCTETLVTEPAGATVVIDHD